MSKNAEDNKTQGSINPEPKQKTKEKNRINGDIQWMLENASQWSPSKLFNASKTGNSKANANTLFWSNDELEENENLKAQVQLIAYLEDLRLVLRMPNGAGERVLRRWLASAWDGYPLSLTNQSNQVASNNNAQNNNMAMLNYCLERRAELSLADPLALVRLTLIEAKELSQEFMARS